LVRIVVAIDPAASTGEDADETGITEHQIRGTPHRIFERYVAFAREASTSGDRVAAENLYQHAEHYFRIMNAANEDHQHRATRPDASADVETEMVDGKVSEMDGPVRASPSQLRT